MSNDLSETQAKLDYLYECGHTIPDRVDMQVWTDRNYAEVTDGQDQWEQHLRNTRLTHVGVDRLVWHLYGILSISADAQRVREKYNATKRAKIAARRLATKDF